MLKEILQDWFTNGDNSGQFKIPCDKNQKRNDVTL